MKIYFDNLNKHTSNLSFLIGDDNPGWLVAAGAPIQHQLQTWGEEVDILRNYDTPGCYFIDVTRDPNWWCGAVSGGPVDHIIKEIPQRIIDMAKDYKLRIIISADREGGPMVVEGQFDCFKLTTDAMLERGLPSGSILITHGNNKIEQQYNNWLLKTNQPKLFDVMYCCHFARVFIGSNWDAVPKTPVILDAINNPTALDYNSLNRVYRSHRGAHLCQLASDGILDKGLVSANQKATEHDWAAIDLIRKETETREDADKRFHSIMNEYYPRFIDGNWETHNAGPQFNTDIYKNSLLTVITETLFLEDVAFLSEKVFKPLMMGHPMLLFAGAGTLKVIENLGFKTDWCGIDTSYDSIVDNRKRFDAVHKELVKWINLSKEEKLIRIEHSMPAIIHNFNFYKENDFYRVSINEVLQKSKEYFQCLT
jgi:hypothetical protein